MIDFERCRKVKNPKNVTQLVQFLTSGKTNHILKDKKIDLNKEELRNLARKYKDKYEEKLFEELKEEVNP
jgi:predicted Ser/Thr protein kinase